jgi:mono/diheme cytochrome c family protein
MIRPHRRSAAPLALKALIALGLLAPASAARAQMGFSAGFSETTGEALYQHVCQGCHMPDAKGAVGAGAYPALAANPRLKAAAYPILVLLNGQRAMPSFAVLSDAQIAGVVAYVRTSFGNRYAKPVTAEEVKALRAQASPPGP